MARLNFTGMIGEIPKLRPRLLPENAAKSCFNVRLTDGGLEPIRQSTLINEFDTPPASDDATIYRNGADWLVWDGLVHAVPGPVAADRLYVTGDGAPKMIVDGVTYPLALARPTTALTGAVSGSATGDEVTRAYVYTLVTEFGEESRPSPLSDDITWAPGQTVTLSGFEVGDPARGVTLQRIYRSQTGPQGTQLYFIAERATSASDFVDNIAVNAIQEPIPSTDWTEPPDELEGLISLPNGMMAAFVGKDLYFCEPYRPHAWPAKYIQTVDYNIVALGAFLSSVVVATAGNPYLASGVTPGTVSMDKLEQQHACVNARGMVDLGYAVAYPSHDGLVVVSQSGARLATENLFSRTDWREISPESLAAANYQGRYFASYDYLDFEGERQVGTFIIDLSGEQPFLIRTDVVTRSFYYEIETARLFYLLDGVVYEWDSEGQPYANQTWRSKEVFMARPTNFGVILVDTVTGLTDEQLADLQAEIDAIQAANQALIDSGDPLGGEVNGAAVNAYAVNGDVLETPPVSNQIININVYADGELKISVNTVNAPVCLPSGFKARQWEVEVIGNVHVEQVSLAGTGRELMGV